jgi:ribosomal protein L34
LFAERGNFLRQRVRHRLHGNRARIDTKPGTAIPAEFKIRGIDKIAMGTDARERRRAPLAHARAN